jgi:hypothetical protein
MGPKVVLLFVLFAPIVAFPALGNPAVLLVIPVSERACTGFLGVARVKQKRRASNASPTHYTPSQGEQHLCGFSCRPASRSTCYPIVNSYSETLDGTF